MSVRITVVDAYENYGRCLKMENDAAELLVTLDVGPRVIGYRLAGGENQLFNDLARDCAEQGAEFDECFYAGAKWYAYGGHRLWASPEIYPTTYYPENEPIEYAVEGNTVRFTPVKQLYTHFRFVTTVTLDETTSRVTLSHEIVNLYKKPVEVAPWAITQMAPGGVEILPQPTGDAGYLANRVLALWTYSDMSDPRVTWGKDYIILRQDDKAETPFKLGINAEQGWAAYINRGAAFIKRFTFVPGMKYPDYGVKYETYTCARFTEMETVGELKTLAPGESVVTDETWELFPQEPFCPCDAAKLAAFVAKL